MKYRESGMPAQGYWETLFDIDRVLNAFGVDGRTGVVAELGCGYGTFTIPVARRTGTAVYTYDIDALMVATTRQRAQQESLDNVIVEERDVFGEGFGLPDESCGACLLFNILHGENPVAMLREANRVLRVGGFLAVIHWRCDIATPRGPSLDIRPRPSELEAWAEQAGGFVLAGGPWVLPPWHYGLRFEKGVR